MRQKSREKLKDRNIMIAPKLERKRRSDKLRKQEAK
jgi:hypothetical protein